MNWDPQTLQSFIYEEIMRFLREGGVPASSPAADFLFLLTSPPEGNVIELSGVKEILKISKCLVIRPFHYRETLPEPFSSLEEIPSNDPDCSPSLFPMTLKALVLFQPTLSFIARFVLGIGEDTLTCLLQTALIQGKPVLGIPYDMPSALSSSLRSDDHDRASQKSVPAGRVRSALLSLYHQYEKTLENWGLEWTPPQNLYSRLQGLADRQTSPITNTLSETTDQRKRAIITSEDVEERIQRGETNWLLPADAIVTDIALETALQKGFTLKRND